MKTIRKHAVLLTLMCLGFVGSFMVLVLVLLLTAAIPPHPPAGVGTAAGNSSGVPEVIGLVALIALMTSVGWWVMAKVAGSLWRMNNDISWKFMMCTGALGFVLSAVLHDAVVLLLVRRFYLGNEELKLEILPRE